MLTALYTFAPELIERTFEGIRGKSGDYRPAMVQMGEGGVSCEVRNACGNESALHTLENNSASDAGSTGAITVSPEFRFLSFSTPI
jgi:hypothetical protein